MKKSLLFIGLFSSSMLLALPSAQAFFLEPSMHYEMGQGKIKSDLAGYEDLDSTVSGTGFGLKAGLSFLVPFFGVDIMYSSPSYTIDGSNLDDGSGHSIWAGVVGGAKLPLVGLRAWASYFPYGAIAAGDLAITGGTAVKFGAGYSILPLLSLNAEYMIQSFGKVKEDNGAGSLPSAEFNNNSLFLSLSIPL